jgi:hypothetical protein
MRLLGAISTLLAAAACGLPPGTSPAQEAQAPAHAAKAPATPPFTIAKETTFYTGPIRADGTVDYVEALNEQLGTGGRREDNAAIPLLEAAALGRAQKAAHYDKVRAKLGVAPAAPPTVQPPDGAPDIFAGAEPPKLEAALRGPWTAEQLPDVAAWLKSLEPRLTLIIEASRRSQFYMPFLREREEDSMILVLLPHLQEQRTLTQALVARAMLALGDEDGNAFRRDVTAVVRIGRLSTRAATVLERLVAIHCEAAGLQAIQVAASGGFLAAAQAEGLADDLRAAPPGLPLHETYDLAERVSVLELLQFCVTRGTDEVAKWIQGTNVKLPPIVAGAGPAEWDAALRTANATYDRMREAGRKPTFARRQEAINAAQADLAKEPGKVTEPVSPAVFAERLLAVLMSSLARADVVETRVRVDRDLTAAALALSRFRAKTGEYPATLKELVPAYLKSELVDEFTERPLVYRTEAGGYVLQSLGANGRDDAGAVGARNDDRVVRAER